MAMHTERTAANVLCAAVRAAHEGDNRSEDSKLVVALAQACIRQGLARVPAGGYKVEATLLGGIGSSVQSVKRATRYATWKYAKIISGDAFCNLFSVESHPDKFSGALLLKVNMPAVIPGASQYIQTILPTNVWPLTAPSSSNRSHIAPTPPKTGTVTEDLIAEGSTSQPTDKPLDVLQLEVLAATMKKQFESYSWLSRQFSGQQSASTADSLQPSLPEETTAQPSPSCEVPSTTSLQSSSDASSDSSSSSSSASSSPSGSAKSQCSESSSNSAVLPRQGDEDAKSDCSHSQCDRNSTPDIEDQPLTSSPSAVDAATQSEPQPAAESQCSPEQPHISAVLSSDPVQSILQLLPPAVALIIQDHLQRHSTIGSKQTLSDIVADSGRPLRLRYCNNVNTLIKEEELPVQPSLDEAVANIKAVHAAQHSGKAPEPFMCHSRTGISGTLHRISAMRNSHGEVYGLTYRVGRHLPDAAEPLKDVVSRVAGGRQVGGSGSLLLLGPPGVGKTTLLRHVTCQLADNFRKLVMVVDTSEEIAGGGHVPHACIGSARRMLGSSQQSKYEALQEAVSNHGPEVIVVDEIGNAKEVAALKDIAERGVAVVATAHGTTLQRLLENPMLNSLVGGKQKMVIGDFMARSFDGRKTRQERCEAPTFSMLVEVLDHDQYVFHSNVAASVDAVLAGRQPMTQILSRTSNP